MIKFIFSIDTREGDTLQVNKIQVQDSFPTLLYSVAATKSEEGDGPETVDGAVDGDEVSGQAPYDSTLTPAADAKSLFG